MAPFKAVKVDGIFTDWRQSRTELIRHWGHSSCHLTGELLAHSRTDTWPSFKAAKPSSYNSQRDINNKKSSIQTLSVPSWQNIDLPPFSEPISPFSITEQLGEMFHWASKQATNPTLEPVLFTAKRHFQTWPFLMPKFRSTRLQEHNTSLSCSPDRRCLTWQLIGPIIGSRCRGVPDGISSHQARGAAEASSYPTPPPLIASLILCHHRKHTLMRTHKDCIHFQIRDDETACVRMCLHVHVTSDGMG